MWAAGRDIVRHRAPAWSSPFPSFHLPWQRALAARRSSSSSSSSGGTAHWSTWNEPARPEGGPHEARCTWRGSSGVFMRVLLLARLETNAQAEGRIRACVPCHPSCAEGGWRGLEAVARRRPHVRSDVLKPERTERGCSHQTERKRSERAGDGRSTGRSQRLRSRRVCVCARNRIRRETGQVTGAWNRSRRAEQTQLEEVAGAALGLYRASLMGSSLVRSASE
ncbi:hypothetical protein ColTof3_04713 [Colletotrichum tofieldiae]|nr:hypothetical protein ColTof3_04713 [Colletotrichum tofieldiae]